MVVGSYSVDLGKVLPVDGARGLWSSSCLPREPIGRWAVRLTGSRKSTWSQLGGLRAEGGDLEPDAMLDARSPESRWLPGL